MSHTVLIAGGSGLIGDELSAKLVSMGYKVRILGRGTGSQGPIQHFTWSPSNQQIDPTALTGVDFVINLAGANVGKGKWTEKRKKELLDSRIDSTHLLANTIIKNKIPIKKFIQASAIGYYGFESDEFYVETDPAGKDFLATLTMQWEESTKEIATANIPLNILRIGVVFSNKGGAFVEMGKPIKFFAGNYLGSGKQMVPWIHVDDMISIFIKSIQEDELMGAYNCAAPEPVSNRNLTKQLAKAFNRPAWPFGVPPFVLRLLLGEQAQIVLEGYRISSEKLRNVGFEFKYPTLDKAIKDLAQRC